MKWLLTLVSVALTGSSFAAELTADIPKDDPAFIAKAISAAPADIGKDATIIRLEQGFKATPVRSGTNIWTCSISPDGTPWCTDAAGLEWFKAISTKAEPPNETGFVYMLAGDMGTSNHDPYATDKSHWVQTGPHVMIVGAAAQTMAGNYPNALDANPANPYVMFPGTKYQHLMFPTDAGMGQAQ